MGNRQTTFFRVATQTYYTGWDVGTSVTATITETETADGFRVVTTHDGTRGGTPARTVTHSWHPGSNYDLVCRDYERSGFAIVA